MKKSQYFERTKNLLKSIVFSFLCSMAFILLSSAAVVKADIIATPVEFKSNIRLSTAPYEIEYSARLSEEQLKGRQITAAKASSKKAEVTYDANSIYFSSPETGKVTFTVTLSAAGKTDLKRKMTVNFINYECPLQKTGLLSSDDAFYQLMTCQYTFYTPAKEKEKIKLKAKKGWKIISINYEYEYYDESTWELKQDSIKVKNNSSFKYPARGFFRIRVKNEKNHFTETIQIHVNASGIS